MAPYALLYKDPGYFKSDPSCGEDAKKGWSSPAMLFHNSVFQTRDSPPLNLPHIAKRGLLLESQIFVFLKNYRELNDARSRCCITYFTGTLVEREGLVVNSGLFAN